MDGIERNKMLILRACVDNVRGWLRCEEEKTCCTIIYPGCSEKISEQMKAQTMEETLAQETIQRTFISNFVILMNFQALTSGELHKIISLVIEPRPSCSGGPAVSSVGNPSLVEHAIMPEQYVFEPSAKPTNVTG